MTEALIEIAKLCDGLRTISYGIVQPGKPTHGGVPIVRVNNFRGNSLSLEDALLVDPDIERKFVRSRPKRDDVLITLVGSMGQVAISPPELEGWNLARAVGLIPTNDRHKAQWIFYALQMPEAQHYIQSRANTTVQATFNLGDLAALKLPFPDRSTREAIIHVLSALDDKIELNLRMNETLEQMAQAIFKDWFVDFGPVRRKQEGASDPKAIMGGLVQDAARAAELAALFPDAFGDNALPMEWSQARIDTMLELAYGKSLPKTARKDGNIPVYGSGGINGCHHEALESGPGIVVGRKGTVGSLFWVQSNFFAIDTVFYVRPKATYELNFIWFMLHRLGLQHMNTDAAVPGLNRENVYRLEFPAAPKSIRVQFASFAGLLRAKIEINRSESSTLAETRDYLLPKLMSGEVRVRDAEKIAEDAL